MSSILSVCYRILHKPRSPLTRSIGFVAAAIALVCLSSIAYLIYWLPSSSSGSDVQAILPISLADSRQRSSARFHWIEGPRRLVAFGDSWSDNGQYPIDPPPEDQVFARDALQGQIWTDWLCAAVGRYTYLRRGSVLITLCRYPVLIMTTSQDRR